MEQIILWYLLMNEETDLNKLDFFTGKVMKHVYFSTKGRINRMRFFLAWLMLIPVSIILGILAGLLMIIPILGWILGFILFLIPWYMIICAAIKRGHDLGLPGLWVIIVNLILPIIGTSLAFWGIYLQATEQSGGAWWQDLQYLFSFISLVFFLFLQFAPGHVEENQWGKRAIGKE